MTRTSRDKINAFHISGAIGVGIIVAAVTRSWMLFLLVTGALIAASLFSGEVRLPQHRRGNRRR